MARLISLSSPHEHPRFEAFLQGREPLMAARFEGHRGGGQQTTGVHAYAVVVLLSEGASRVQHAGNLDLRAGDVHLIPPGDAHGSGHFENGSGWALAFWPERLKHSWKLFSRVRQGCHPVLHPTARQRSRLEGWFRALEKESEGEAEGREEALGALLQLVLVELTRITASPLKAGNDASTLVRRVLDHVEVNALQPLTLSDVARAVSRSPAHVATEVRKATGRTVGEWILTQRMGEARIRLRETDDSLDEVARRVGYADPTHFIRQFKSVHGTTPARWRRSAGPGSSSGEPRTSA